MEKQQTLNWRLPTVTHEAQCDEVRLYFRGYGASDYQPQPMFSSPYPQQSRHISLSHGPYDLISMPLKFQQRRFLKSNSAMSILSTEVQREKSIEPETTENKNLATKEDLLESLYWNIHGGSFFHLIQCL